MPNSKSAKRRVRRVKIQTAVNRVRKSKFKTTLKEMKKLIISKKKKEALKELPDFNSKLMKIGKTGAINKKVVSRQISRITKQISKL